MLVSQRAFGTASTQIWNPSADVLKSGTVHFGIDNYFSIHGNASNDFQLAPDPFYFNFKFGVPESGPWPAVAVGGFNFGTRSGVTDYNMLYGATARTLPVIGRLTFGFYRGMNARLFPDLNGDPTNSGIIASWDRALTEKIWACVDYASGESWYGTLSAGGSYAFSPDVSVIFGYVIFNSRGVVPNNAFTTQLDINLH